MEIMEHVIKNSLPQFMENDDGYTSDDIISSDQMSSGYGASLSFPSPPYSPQDDESNVGTETCYDCESVTMVAARMLEPAITCKCHICFHSTGPLIKDCMWSAGVAVPNTTPRSGKSDSEVADSVKDVKSEVEKASSYEVVDSVLCARLAEYRQAHPGEHFTAEKAAKSADISSASCSYWVSKELYLSDGDSSGEVDVVSVTPRKLIPLNGPHQMLVLPASTTITERVAALHSYSAASVPLVAEFTSSSCLSISRLSPSSSRRPIKTRYTSTFKLRRSKDSSVNEQLQLGNAFMANSCSPKSDSDDYGSSSPPIDFRVKRSMHNVLERRRRSSLKLNFHSLRDVVPSIAGNGKISKVTILKSAHSHLVHLVKTNQFLQAEWNRLRSLNQRWQRKLALTYL